jgi:hypothetical protein
VFRNFENPNPKENIEEKYRQQLIQDVKEGKIVKGRNHG